jgi:exopolyphosphatase/guanosine-5'-triphosphate,3'-diphosphate pyrophosphatase
VREQLQKVRSVMEPSRAHRMIGLAGTITALALLRTGSKRYDPALTHHSTLTRPEVEALFAQLARADVGARRAMLAEPKRAEVIVGGAAILEAVVRHLGLESVASVDTGLRNGILVDLVRRATARPDDHTTAEAALALGRRFRIDERHAVQVGALAVTLFEDLATLHRLPASARRVLEAAALLHDVGTAVSPHKHHKHTHYLIANSDLPGFANQERDLVAVVARYHRRSVPDAKRADLAHLSAAELQTVRKLAAILRVANALDASHQLHVRSLRAAVRDGAVTLRVRARGPLDLEAWEVERDAAFFRAVFKKRVQLVTTR